MQSAYNIGIIGAGKFSHRHIQAIASVDGIRVEAACRSSRKELDQFCAKYEVRGFTDYHLLLADPLIDGVLISTPHHLHTDIAIDAARAGKHILLEKPFAPTVAECRSIIKEVERADVKLMLGHTTQFSAAFLAAERIIEEGQLGKIVQGIATTNSFWMGPDRKAWHLKKESGGGYMYTLGIHQVDALVSLVGSRVQSLRAEIGSKFHSHETDDHGILWLRFENGVVATVLFTGYTHGVTKVESELFCERGIVKFSTREGTFIGSDEKWSIVPGSLNQNWLDDALVGEWYEFGASIRENRHPKVSGAHALHVMEIIEASFVSAREQSEINL